MGAIDALSAAVANMREGDDPRLSLEVALLKVARPALDSSQEALMRRIESLEKALAGAPAASPHPPQAAPAPAPAPAKDPPSADDSSPADPPPKDPPQGTSAAAEAEAGEPEQRGPVAKASQTASAVVTSIEIERVVEMWPAVVEHVRSSGSEMLSSLFDGARPLAIDAERSVLKIGFPSSAKFNKRKAEARANVDRISGSVKAILGESLRPVYELMETDVEPVEANGKNQMAEEEIIDLIITKFDASEVVEGDDAKQSEAG
jgi:DNA polymerase III gamma/tau subunit